MSLVVIDPKKVGSINDGGRRLKPGTHAYGITGASMAVVKSNHTGKEQQVVFDLEDVNDEDYHCKLYLNVMSPNEAQCNIAQKILVGIAQAAGIDKVLKLPVDLKLFLEKAVVITAKETTGKGDKKGESYMNVLTVEPYESGEEAEEEETEEAEEESEEEETEETEETEEEETEPEPEPEPAKKPAAKAGKPKPAAAPAGKARPW